MKFSEALKHMEEGKICKQGAVFVRIKNDKLQYSHYIDSPEWPNSEANFNRLNNENWGIYEEPKEKIYYKHLVQRNELIVETEWTSSVELTNRENLKIYCTVEATEKQIVEKFKEMYK